MKQSVLHSDNDDDSDVEFLMNDGDLNSILNDPELNRELMALVEETPIAFHQSHVNNSYEKANRNSDIPTSPVDVSMINIEHNIDIIITNHRWLTKLQVCINKPCLFFYPNK